MSSSQMNINFHSGISLDSITDSVDMNLGKLWEMVRDRKAWHAVVQRVDL